MRVVIQGITGKEGLKHTKRMLNAKTEIVGGVNPRKAGEVLEFDVENKLVKVPVFGNVQDAIDKTRATVSIVFVPPAFVKDAVVEAINAKIELIVIITEGVPVHDSAYFTHLAKINNVQIIGPNCPGLILNGVNLGIIPDGLAPTGKVGLVSKSGTLTYQMLNDLKDIGVKSAFGIGGDPIVGTVFIDVLKDFEMDSEIEAIVLIGEIGGTAEEAAAEYIKTNVKKPVFAYIAGVTAPVGKTMGHAGAIVTPGSGDADSKKNALENAGCKVGKTPEITAQLVLDWFNGQK